METKEITQVDFFNLLITRITQLEEKVETQNKKLVESMEKENMRMLNVLKKSYDLLSDRLDDISGD